MNENYTHEQKLHRLTELGFVCGTRDSRLNRNYPGAFMVVECHEENELPTDDGRNGPWCIVGDDFPALVAQAWDIWSDEYADNERRALIVAKLCDDNKKENPLT